MDSGVETGNDSNDSLVIQNDNFVTMNSVGTSNQMESNINEKACNTRNMHGTSSEGDHTRMIVSTEATSHESLPGASETIQNTTSNSLVSVGTFNFTKMYSLPILNAADIKAMINQASNKPLDLDLGFTMNHKDNYQEPFSYLMTSPNYVRKMKTITYNPATAQRLMNKNIKDRLYSNAEVKMRIAAKVNNLRLMQDYLDAGISPNNADEQGRTPLHLAASRGYTEMVRRLLCYKADPNLRDCLGNTPLHLAAVASKISVVTLLLLAGTDVLSSDYYGRNPLQLAQSKLRILQTCRDSDANHIREEMQSIVFMLITYLKKQKYTREQVDTLTTFCAGLSVSNTSDELQEDVRNLLANVNSLSLTN